MFSHHANAAVGFQSESSKEKSVKTSSSQTGSVKSDEKDVQVYAKANACIQTDSLQKSSDIFADYDVENLSSFLNRVESSVCSVLVANNRSKAFDNYELLSDMETTSITCLHTLEKSTTEELNCCSISWNSMGTSIASAYTDSSHENWCEHDGSVGIWSLNQKNFDSSKPNIVLETDCCITFVAFHPTIPALLVAGKFNGEIMLWNIAKEDDSLLGSSEASFNNHREPIAGLIWLPESISYESVQFLSYSLDGKILIWKLEKNILIPHDGFIILSEFLPRNFQIKSTRENSEVGILSLSINHEDPSIFIMGTEGGGILQGSFSSLSPASYSGMSSIPLKNPLSMCFERQKGQVTSVQFSPFSRNIFLSSGSDGEVRVYTLLQTKPVIILSSPNVGVNSAAWSLVRPMVLYSICSDSQLHIWDLMANSKLPTESLQMDSKYSAGMCLQHNQTSKNLMATSLSDGKIHIWRLPGFVQKPHTDELQQLQNISKSTDNF